MTREQAQQFLEAYNTLLTIFTRGNDTRAMAHVLEIMERLANTIEIIEPSTVAPAIEEG